MGENSIGGANGPYEYTGTVHQVGRTQTFQSGFAKRTLVLVADPKAKYPDYAAFDFTKSKKDGATDRTRFLDGIAPGEAVTVKFYLSANENRNKAGQWFLSANGVEVYRADGSSASVKAVRDMAGAGGVARRAEEAPTVPEAADDGMPF